MRRHQLTGPTAPTEGNTVLARRTSLRVAVAALGLGTLLAVGSAPAFAANEGNHYLTAGPCAATQKIELRYYGPGSGHPVGYHDVQAIDPTHNGTQAPFACQFVLKDQYGNVVGQSRDGSSESDWVYDGPGFQITAYVYYTYNDLVRNSAVGVTN
ncbi:hypothetical protein GCM10009665_47360 [Kitasatospora nipponensis]|uniref:Secreted protein n=1 Tax=Kitasatospora nipponensis TaxID=258049 RepID=A0ABN1WI42_9ACTN